MGIRKDNISGSLFIKFCVKIFLIIQVGIRKDNVSGSLFIKFCYKVFLIIQVEIRKDNISGSLFVKFWSILLRDIRCPRVVGGNCSPLATTLSSNYRSDGHYQLQCIPPNEHKGAQTANRT